MSRGRADELTGSMSRCVEPGTGEVCSGGGFEGGLEAECVELADVVALLAVWTDAGVVEGRADVLLGLVVEMDVLHGVFTTTDLTSGQWLVCVAIGSVILWVGELVKLVLRTRTRRSPSR
jgi:hypothetical protein